MAASTPTATRCGCTDPEDCVDRRTGRYLTAVHWLAGSRGRARTGAVSDRLGVTPATVTEMFERLTNAGLVDYEKRALFPSFGLDLANVPSPVAVPTAHGELDHGALADALGVDLGARPFAERTLWQAFAYAAFDPHRNEPPQIRQTEGGLLVVANPET